MIKLELNKNEMEKLTEEEIEIAKARKLEILILPFLRRNMKFFYAGGDLQGKAKAYKQPIDKYSLTQSITSKKNNIPTVCKPLCDMVVEILRSNGIKADTVSCDTDIFKHTDVLLETKSGKKYIINYLEDIESIQSGMRTPDFASEEYYKRRYEKFENGYTTDGKSLEGIEFLNTEEVEKIDTALGYRKYNMYMNDVIQQIKKEFADFKNIMADSEFISKQMEIEKNDITTSEDELEKTKQEILNKYNTMTQSEELEAKLDWVFNYFNDRMDIKGHADFVMYYSRLLLKEILTKEEYSQITRYDCSTSVGKIPEDSKINEILDYNNPDNVKKSRFCMLEAANKLYVFSTKPNSYIKLEKKELDELEKYINISKSEKPSDLMLNLCDRGNALPLVFHPLGSKLLNERAELIDKNLTQEEREKAIQELSSQIITSDEPITSILIPYPNGKQICIYINSNNEFVMKDKNKETIFHYNEEDDSFSETAEENKEIIR